MKRIGEKGEGKWQRISPEEALDTIALKIRRAKEEYGPESIAFIHCDGPRGNFEPACALTNAPGNRMICGTDAHYCFRPQGVACMATFGRGTSLPNMMVLILQIVNASSPREQTISKVSFRKGKILSKR